MDTTTPATARRARWQLAGLALADVAVLGALASGAPLPGPAAIASGSVEEAVLAAGRLVAATLAGWVLVSLVLAVALAVRPESRTLRRWTSRLAPRLVRAVAGRAAGAVLLAGTIAPSVAVASEHAPAAPLPPPALLEAPMPPDPPDPPLPRVAPPAAVATDTAPAPRVAEPPDVPTPARAADPDDSPPATTPPAALPPTARERTVTVAPGDHLWGLTAEALATARGIDPAELDPADIAGPWRATVERNRPDLASGDPDLIHPGEVVTLVTDTTPQEERP